MLKTILDAARAVLAEVTDERIAALETACRDADTAQTGAAANLSPDAGRLRAESQRVRR